MIFNTYIPQLNYGQKKQLPGYDIAFMISSMSSFNFARSAGLLLNYVLGSSLLREGLGSIFIFELLVSVNIVCETAIALMSHLRSKSSRDAQTLERLYIPFFPALKLHKANAIR